MKKLILLAGMLSASCASNTELYRVHHVIAETDSTIDVWSSDAFWTTNIEITRDSIFFWEQFDKDSDTMTMNYGYDFKDVIELTDSTLTMRQPDQVITYLFKDASLYSDNTRFIR